MEPMLKLHHKWRGKAVLVQIANPAGGRGKDLAETQTEIAANCKKINDNYGLPGL